MQYTIKLIIEAPTDTAAEDQAADILGAASDYGLSVVASSMEKLIPARSEKMWDPLPDHGKLIAHRNAPMDAMVVDE